MSDTTTILGIELPDKITCPHCGNDEISCDGEGACKCANGHYFWDTQSPEWLALREKQRAEHADIPIRQHGCARCGATGHDLQYKEFKQPIEIPDQPALTHWALCPVTGEPILMRFEPKTFICRR